MLGILGGSFDPIHNGHLAVAEIVYKKLALSELYFLPCGQHAFGKTLHADRASRLAMLVLALENKPYFKIDRQELERDGPSYAIDTLKNLRTKIGKQESLVWIIGYDALFSLPQWKAWEHILNYCHLVVVTRKVEENNQLTQELKKTIQQHFTNNVQSFHETAAGKIYFFHIPAINISSTQIRQQLISQGKISQNILPDKVWKYIQSYQLYKNSNTAKSTA